MEITRKELEQAFIDYGPKFGGKKEDYFALVYLIKKFNLSIGNAHPHVAFEGNDYGIDAFHVDKDRHNLYMFQFKWSKNHHLFEESFKRLNEEGMERVFGNPLQDQRQNQLLLQLKSDLAENRDVINQVLFLFIFNGDPAAAERSATLDSLRETLESKKYLIDHISVEKWISLPSTSPMKHRRLVVSATQHEPTSIQ
jgi:hypothetical protein